MYEFVYVCEYMCMSVCVWCVSVDVCGVCVCVDDVVCGVWCVCGVCVCVCVHAHMCSLYLMCVLKK